jgi:hypothetical protein
LFFFKSLVDILLFYHLSSSKRKGPCHFSTHVEETQELNNYKDKGIVQIDTI